VSIVQHGPALVGQQLQVRGCFRFGLCCGGEVAFAGGGGPQRGFQVPPPRRQIGNLAGGGCAGDVEQAFGGELEMCSRGCGPVVA
jgi:hypothetical protein